MIPLEEEISRTEEHLLKLRKELKKLREGCKHVWGFKYSNDYTGYDTYECPKCGEKVDY